MGAIEKIEEEEEEHASILGSTQQQHHHLEEKLINKNGEQSKKNASPFAAAVAGAGRAPIFAICSSLIGSSFQFGYHCGCINLPADFIQNWIMETHEQMYGIPIGADSVELIWAIAVGIFAVGGMVGSICVGPLADHFGRRTGLLYNNVLALIGISLMTSAKYVGLYWLFVIGRFVIGLNAGINSALVPMYLMEISPMHLRGSIGSLAQLAVTVSILIAQIMGLPFLFGTDTRWPFIFGFALIPMAFQIVTIPFCPESPKFTLALNGNVHKAESDLKKLRGQIDVMDELGQMIAECLIYSPAAAADKITSTNFRLPDLLKKPLIWPLTLAIFMHLSQHFSGINTVIFYSATIFKKSGLSEQMSNYATITMGVVNVLMTIFSTYLVDRLGRRTLQIGGLAGLALSTFMIGVSMIISKSIHWFSLVTIIFVIWMVVSIATGPGSIPWFYVNEIFPMNARASANSFAVFTNWSSNAFVTTLFPLLENILHEYTFFIFTTFMCFSIIFAFKYMPETKNKTLAQVQEAMGQQRMRIDQ